MNDREALPYYIVLSAFGALETALPRGGALTLNLWNLLSVFVSTVVFIAGVIYCFRHNGGKAGYDFIQKSIVLGWVVAVRLLLLYFILCHLAGGLLKGWLGQSYETDSWVDTVLIGVMWVIYYQRLGRHIRDTRRESGEPPVSDYASRVCG